MSDEPSKPNNDSRSRLPIILPGQPTRTTLILASTFTVLDLDRSSIPLGRNEHAKDKQTRATISNRIRHMCTTASLHGRGCLKGKRNDVDGRGRNVEEAAVVDPGVSRRQQTEQSTPPVVAATATHQ
jgi:hypothetical protein